MTTAALSAVSCLFIVAVFQFNGLDYYVVIAIAIVIANYLIWQFSDLAALQEMWQ